MKKHVQLFLLVLFTSSFLNEIKAQIFFTETFEGTMGANGIPAGWAETGLSTDGIFAVGDEVAASSPFFVFPVAIEGTQFAFTNDDACNCDKSVDRLILPAQDFTMMSGVSLIFDLYHTGAYGGVATVEVSTTGSGGPWTTVATLPESGTWQNDLVTTLVDYAGLNNVTIAFRYNDAATWAGGMGVDEVRLEQLVTLSPDMELTSANADEYTIVPFTQITPSALSAVVTNVGSAITTDAALTVNVYAAPNLITPIQTTSSTATTVNAGATANLTAGTFTPTALGSYLFEYIVSATGDANAANDTLYSSLIIDPSVYARDDSAPSASFGIGAGPSGYIGYKFDIVATTAVDSVFGVFNKPGTDAVSGDGVGDVTRFVIYDVVGGLPSTIIGTSDIYTFTAADTLGLAAKTFAIQATGGGQLTLTAGTYFVAVEENNTNVGFTFTDNNFQTTTFYISWTGQPWTGLEAFPAQFQKVPLLRAVLGCVAPTSSVSVSSNYNGAQVTCAGESDGEAIVTASGGTAPYVYLWSDGQSTATASNLAAGTYQVTVTDNASCSSTSSITITEPGAISFTLTSTDVTVAGGTDGSIDLTVSGGTSPYTYLWNNSETTEDLSGLPAGTYICTITDANGCTSEVTVTILDGVASLVNNNTGMGVISLFPNPATEEVTLSFDLTQTSDITIEVVSTTGQVLTVINDVDVLNTNYVLDISKWSTGVYFVKIKTTDGMNSIRFVKK